MTADIVAAALAGLGPMIQQGSRKPVNRFEARRKFGDALLTQGSQTTPIQGGVVEGLARAAQGALGGWMSGKADRDQIADDDKKNALLMTAIDTAKRTGDFSPVAQALAASGLQGPAATLMFADHAQRQQQAARQQTATTLFGGGGGQTVGGGAGGTYDQRVSATESPNGATNPGPSGASGYYQFLPDTAHALAQQTAWGRGLSKDQVLAVVRDPNRRAEQDELMKLYTAQSDATLTQAGIPVNDVTRFTLHAFGPAGGVSLLRAPDNMPVDQWVRSVNWGRATPEQVIAENRLDKYQTVGQLRQDFIARRIGGGNGGATPVGTGTPGAPTQTASVTNTPTMTGVQLPGQSRPVQLAQAGPLTSLPSAASPLTLNPDGSANQPPPPPRLSMAPAPGGQPQPMPGAQPQPVSPTPPAPPEVPRPQLPPQDAARLRQAVASGAMTGPQAQAEANRIIDNQWQVDRERAGRQHAMDLERWKHERNSDDVRIKDVDGLRKEIRALPDVKALGVVAPLFGSMVKSAKVNGRAADLDLIYGLATILDPGSVVREQDAIMVQRTGGLSDQVRGYISAVNGGAALTPEVRAGIMQIAASRVSQYKSAADSAIAPYRGVVERRPGWKWEDVEPGIMPIPDYVPGSTSVEPRPSPRDVAPGQQPQARQFPAPPPEAVADLKRNPGTAAQFDEVFGPGAAQRALGGR